jgi:hypothetical protein
MKKQREPSLKKNMGHGCNLCYGTLIARRIRVMVGGGESYSDHPCPNCEKEQALSLGEQLYRVWLAIMPVDVLAKGGPVDLTAMIDEIVVLQDLAKKRRMQNGNGTAEATS